MAKTINVHFVLDKSGSMSSVRDATISGFNEYVQTLKKDENNYTLTLTLFDTEVKKKYTGEALSRVTLLKKDDYNPSGMTALYDAVCQTLKDVESSRGKNLFVIMTDGEENSSQEYTEKELKKMIKNLEETKRWTFVFLGANQDSWLVGQKFGLSRGNVANYNATLSGMGATMKTMARNTVAFAAQSNDNTDQYFSKTDQDELKNA